MFNKKAISPVVALALLLVVAVTAVVSFQNWYGDFSSSLQTKTETQSSGTITQIERVVNDNLYFRIGYPSITISDVNVEGNSCNISGNYSKGVKKLALGNNCTQNLSTTTPKLVVETNKGLYSHQFFKLKSQSLSTSQENSSNESNENVTLCKYPLDDDGTIASAFSYDLLNMLPGTNYTEYSHTIVEGDSPGHVGVHSNPFSNYSMAVDSGIHAFEVEITDLPDMSSVPNNSRELNIETFILGTNGVDNLGGDTLTFRIRQYKNKMDLFYTSYSGDHSGEILEDAGPVKENDRIGFYVNTTSGDVGVIFKGVDLGFLGTDIRSASSIPTAEAVAYTQGLAFSDSVSSYTGGDTIGAKTIYTSDNFEYDYYSGTQDICNGSTSSYSAPSCSISLDASEYEIDLLTSSGGTVENSDMKLSMSNNNMTATYTVQSGLSSARNQYAATKNSQSYLSGTQLDTTSGVTTVAMNIDNASSINDDITQSFQFINYDMPDIISIYMSKNSSGYNVEEAFSGTDIVTGLSTPPNQIAVYFNASAGQYGVAIDSTDYGYVDTYNTSKPFFPMFAITEQPGISGVHAGEKVQMTYVQNAAGITANVPSGTTDNCGVSI